MKVRVYAVDKKKGWDVLSHKDMQSGNIPKTVTHVHITWGNGKENKTISRDEFLATFKHIYMEQWESVESAPQVKEAIEPKEVKQLRKLVAVAVKKAEQAMESRRALGVGATRARVTTANARWASACEYRDHLQKKLEAMLKEVSA